MSSQTAWQSKSFAEPQLVSIPAGWFLMGCAEGRDDEKPVHRVWVDAFEIAICQVTRAEYVRYLAETESTPPPFWEDVAFSHPQQPVVGPSWHDAIAFCDWLNAVSGSRYRLPTEAEWERAARGGSQDKLYPWGDAPPESLPNYAARWMTGPEPVGLYA